MAGEDMMKITLKEEAISGERAIIMENSFFKSIIIPDKAMFPATYLYKPTGHHVFLQRATVEESYANLDGLYDCLPWVGDSKKRGETKGLLKTAVWQVETGIEGDKATARFNTDITYADLTTGKTNRLAFVKAITGSGSHAQLRMDYEVENIGVENAKFILVGHTRIAAGGTYDSGDYVYVPGTNCWITEFKWPALDVPGVKPYSWAHWPVEGVIDFAPKVGADKKGEYIHAFVPAPWAVVGDGKSSEYTVFNCSPVRIGKTMLPQPYWCILHRDNDYILELSMSRDIDAKNWDESWATVALAPGEKLLFTLSMTPGHGLLKADFEKVIEASPAQLIISGSTGQTNRVVRLTQ